jgi:hypothetical protein
LTAGVTLGVLGTMVWDTIEHPSGDVVERWGGITYSLAAAAAAAPAGWRIRPIVRLGTDLADRGWRFLASVPGLELPGAVREVDEPNNRVRLRYRDRHHRDEQLRGGVAGWAWEELAPCLEGLDGLYVNLISGFELGRQTAGRLAGFDGPRYLDVHSLVLGIDDDGHRIPRRPEAPRAWLDAFHVIQANRSELGTLAGDEAPEAVARAAVRRGVRAVVVTRGPEGATWFAPADGPVWSVGPAAGPGAPGAGDGAGPDPSPRATVGEVPLDTPVSTGDPTGCGDVWGATCFVELVRGRRLSDAMTASNRAAARNVDHRGAEGLYQHLRADA